MTKDLKNYMTLSMASTSFFVMIKPDGVGRGLVGEIISRFERRGFIMQKARLIDKELCSRFIDEHYKAHSDKSFYDELISFSLTGSSMIMEWSGNLRVARNLIGSTIPWDAEAGTIRGDLACSNPANLVHCSADQESASRELSLWKELL